MRSLKPVGSIGTATPDKVFSGETFSSDDGLMQTGTALATPTDVAPETLFKGKTAYDDKGNLVTGTFDFVGTFKQYKVANNGHVSTGGFVKFVNESIGMVPEPVDRDAYNYQFTTTLVGGGYKAFVLDDTHCLIFSIARSKKVYIASVVTYEPESDQYSYTEYQVSAIGSNVPYGVFQRDLGIVQVSKDKYLVISFDSSDNSIATIVSVSSDFTITTAAATVKSPINIKPHNYLHRSFWGFCQLSSSSFAFTYTTTTSGSSYSYNAYVCCGTFDEDTTVTFGSSYTIWSASSTSSSRNHANIPRKLSESRLAVLYASYNSEISMRIFSVTGNTLGYLYDSTIATVSSGNITEEHALYISKNGYGFTSAQSDSNTGNVPLWTFYANPQDGTITAGTKYITAAGTSSFMSACELKDGYGLFMAYAWGSPSATRESAGTIQFIVFKQDSSNLILGDVYAYKLGYFVGESSTNSIGWIDSWGADMLTDDIVLITLNLAGATVGNYIGEGKFLKLNIDYDNLSCTFIGDTEKFEDHVDAYAVGDTIAGISIDAKTAGELARCYIAEGMER